MKLILYETGKDSKWKHKLDDKSKHTHKKWMNWDDKLILKRSTCTSGLGYQLVIRISVEKLWQILVKSDSWIGNFLGLKLGFEHTPLDERDFTKGALLEFIKILLEGPIYLMLSICFFDFELLNIWTFTLKFIWGIELPTWLWLVNISLVYHHTDLCF